MINEKLPTDRMQLRHNFSIDAGMVTKIHNTMPLARMIQTLQKLCISIIFVSSFNSSAFNAIPLIIANMSKGIVFTRDESTAECGFQKTTNSSATPERLVHQILAPAEASLVAPASVVLHQTVFNVPRVTTHVRPIKVNGERCAQIASHERLLLVGTVHADLRRGEVDPEAAELGGAEDRRRGRVGVEVPSRAGGVAVDRAVCVVPASDNDLPDVGVVPGVLLARHPVAVAGDAALELHPEVLLGAAAQNPGVGRDRVDTLRAPVVSEPRVHQPLREAPPALRPWGRGDGYVGRTECGAVVPADRVRIADLPEANLAAAPVHSQSSELVTRQKVF